MKFPPAILLVTTLSAASALAASWVWLVSGAGREIARRDPFPVDSLPRFTADLPGVLTRGEGVPAEKLPGSWPRFRGPFGDGVADEDVPLLDRWPAGGPPRRWSVPLGEGYAGPAVHKGRVYVLDYEEGRAEGAVVPARRGDALRCLSLGDGVEIWRRWYHLPMVRSHGISRTVPAVTDRFAVSLGPMGHVLCVDAATGEAKWSRDLVAEFGALIPEWYAAQCPRIDVIGGAEAAVLAPGGDRGVLMLAIDCATGRELWRTPNPKRLQMTHSSIASMDWEGTPTFVYCTTGGVVGVAADDGRLLWEYPGWTIAPAIVPTPVVLEGNRILLTGGYKAGSLLLELRAGDDGKPAPVEIARLDERTFSVEQQTPIAFGDCIYGVLTKGSGPKKEQLVCLSPAGALLWSSGPERLFQLGPQLLAGDKLLLLDDHGTLTMVRHSATGYEELARSKLLDGHECWGPMALAGGLLLVRDLHTLVCLDLRDPAGKKGG
ncbi:MAG: polyvinylalcohol dehydrogenase [Planctomycetes bacterium]|nr:polyvinylalcohol dehydrogenase [Planctomycetota bacterium]